MIEIRRCGAGVEEAAGVFSAVLKAESKRLLLHLQNLWQICRDSQSNLQSWPVLKKETLAVLIFAN